VVSGVAAGDAGLAGAGDSDGAGEAGGVAPVFADGREGGGDSGVFEVHVDHHGDEFGGEAVAGVCRSADAGDWGRGAGEYHAGERDR